ncbi:MULTISPECIES: type IVB secretion system protein IcmH/DotU [unclassified Pseudomonas]|uniref:type IVB secretion system protein IcmH/DotU n=1 Tax=unclassified Pseudomonas TaxID=196821 RepID=UPI0014731BD0|nr:MULTISPECIES: type IVB secretion system protein IcmH/DotU [unclassified Pseudomonas]NMX90799.1 DotU family type IV/VI secretion system protein [Pseudomonas sp. WS 5086]NMY45597.1 DotU family type IV/VI secretion system protein [Pseudomonas sp. WS 5027]
MTTENAYPQDDRTVLLDRQGLGPAQGAMTDFEAPPRFEQLEDRMIYAAHLHGAQHFRLGLNPLVTLAWELLSEVVRLKGSPAREGLHALNERLSAGITRFENQARHEAILDSQIMAARYVLCSVIDEAVVTTAWGSQSDWSQISLLSRFHNETFGGEKFFELLERLSRDPIKHLAMLELMYLCLALGFEGKYRVMERGLLQLDGIRDALYRQINHVRGDAPLDSGARQSPTRKPRKAMRIVSATWVWAFVVMGLVILYAGFAWVLGEQRESVLQPYLPSTTDIIRTPL